MDAVVLHPDRALTEDELVAVARHGARVEISPESLTLIRDARAHVDALAASDVPVYGVSTGFGALATRHIPVEKRTQLQRSLVRSHAASTGAEVEREVVRGLALLRLRTLATGRTGVRAETAEAYAGLLNAGITPIVREYGSLGCSGDLARSSPRGDTTGRSTLRVRGRRMASAAMERRGRRLPAGRGSGAQCRSRP